MKTSFELIAEFRDDQGKGASRRLRHAGSVPAILYGGAREPRALSMNHNKVSQALENDRFYSSIITLKVGDVTQQAILRDVQRHPWKNQIVHVDFQRVFEDQKIRLPVPLHFVGEAAAPGIKIEGGMMSHLKNEVLVECLPGDLPDHVTVDTSALHLNQSIHLADLPFPAGVTAVDAMLGRNPVIVAVHAQRTEEEAAPAADAAAGKKDAKKPAGKK